MPAGRRRKPTKLHILHGNPGRRPLPKNEPNPKVEAPQPPAHIVGEALKEWERISAELLKLGLLTHCDRAALAGYCAAWARWVEAENHLRLESMIFKAPSGYPVISPWWSIANKALDHMAKFLTEFGLSPASRARLGSTKQESVDDELSRYLA